MFETDHAIFLALNIDFVLFDFTVETSVAGKNLENGFYSNNRNLTAKIVVQVETCVVEIKSQKLHDLILSRKQKINNMAERPNIGRA